MSFRIGIVGAGFGSQVHVPAFRAAGGEVVAIAASTEEKAQAIASSHDIPSAYGDWRALVSAPDIDVVSIATPPWLHADIVQEALKHGKHVLCEKPFCMTAAEGAACVDVAQASSLRTAINFEFREIPAFQSVHNMYREGFFGELRHVHVRWITGGWCGSDRPWSWQCDASRGGGVLGALGVHVFDYLAWMFGPIVSVSAALHTGVPKRPLREGGEREVTAEDNAHVLLRFENGAIATVTVSQVAAQGTGHWLEVHGSKGSATAGSPMVSDYGKGFSCSATSRSDGQTFTPDLPVSPADAHSDGRIGLMESLAAKFVQGEGDLPSFVDGLRSQLVRFAALQSQKEARWVDISEVEK